MNVFVTGASGFLGGTVAHALLAAGHRVRGLTRDPSTADRLGALGIDAVVGQLDDLALLTDEARAADAVVNAANADHAPSVVAMLEALAGTGKAFVHTSGTSVVGDDARGESMSEAVFDEDTPFVIAPLKQARRHLDVSVLRSADRGVRSIVVCPSLVYGTGRGLNPNSIQIPFLLADARSRGAVRVVGRGANVWSTVHVDDVADLYVRGIDTAPAGAFYFAENGESSFAAIGAALARRLSFGPVESIDADAAAALWGPARAYFTFGGNSRVRGVRARRELGWRPRHGSVIDWIANDMPL